MSNTEGGLQGSPTLDVGKEAPVCPLGTSLRSLRDYLFRLREGISPDETLAQHVEAGCTACAKRIEQLNLVEPYLRDGLNRRLAILVEEVTPQRATEIPRAPADGGDVEAERQSLQLTLAQGLVRLLVKPIQAWSLPEMWDLNNSLHSAPGETARRTIVTRLQRAAEAQLQDVPDDLQQEVKAFSESLLTGLMRGDAPDLSQRTAEFRRAFLLSLITREWFLNPGGEPLWSIRPGSDNDVRLELKKGAGLAI
jgi:hypothetical protein